MAALRPATVVVLCLFLYPALAVTQEGNVIRGKVRSKEGRAVSQATVDLRTGTGSTIGQTVTNNER